LTQHHHDGEGCTCDLIDVHAHCLSVRYRQALTDAGLLSLDGGYPIPDWSSKLALEVMDRDGIDTMLLSVTSPTVSFLKTAGERVKLARQINEELAQTAKEHPGRFGGFATLPLPHVAECVAEVRYALDELKLDGAIIQTNADGRYLGNPELEPIFGELNEHEAKVFSHPTTPACFEKVGLQRRLRSKPYLRHRRQTQ
jgi:6-methylsalicylate decarboxylase